MIELTREVLHGFYGRSIDHLTHYLHEDFVWIGAFDFQFATSKNQFLDMIHSEMQAIAFSMEDEQYEVLTRDRDTWILYCRFKLSAPLSDMETLQTNTRLTVIWRYVDGVPMLIHIHGSNAQDIPLTVSDQIHKSQNDGRDFIECIKNNEADSPRILFRSTGAEHQIFPERDIIYLKAAGQKTHVVTKSGEMVASGILGSHQKKLTDTFYRVHKSYLVNLNYATAISRYQLTLLDKTVIPISQECYLPLKAHFNGKS